MLYGTLANVATVALGSLLGIFLARFFEKSRRLKKLPDALMKAISLCVIFIGIKGALDGMFKITEVGTVETTGSFIIVLISMVVGTAIGSLVKIDHLLKKLGDFIESKMTKSKKEEKKPDDPNQPITAATDSEDQRSISKAFVATTLTCCVGAMAIMGALNAGLNGDHSLLYTKAVLDFITAFVYSSAFGIGAIFAAVPIFLYQGAIELGAGFLSGILQASVNEMSIVGSIIVMGLGLNMLGATKIKIANMLPAIFLPILLCLIPIF